MTANAKLNRGSYRKIADLMSEAFDMCERDTEENGSDNEDVVGEIESAMKHLKQFRSGGQSDICKKTSATIDLVRGFGLAMQPDRPMRLASKFLFAIDEMMLDGPSGKPHVVVTYLASHLKYEVSDGRSGSEPYVHYYTNGEGGLIDCDCGECGTATLALKRAISGLGLESGHTIEFLKGE
tara:strand:- start:373 stop:915 length:543 start_codon:yes stop_codon:yes gene_type:complete